MATSPTRDDATKAIDTCRRFVPLTRLTTGRAIASLSASSPIAPSTERKAIHRATISFGVAAVSDVDGITNCGAGPVFGPTANVNAPRTGWPSTEMARQYTRYHPSTTCFNG